MIMLLTPGPTAVPEFVRTAMSTETLHHRTPEFENIFKETRELLLKLLNMPEAVILASTGTGAMEACVTNLTSSKALTINSGKFGERFGKICKAHNIDYTELKYDWNVPASLNDIEKVIQEDSTIDSICIQLCESAGGLRHPVEQIAKAVKKINPNIMIIADGITAVGVEYIDTTDIDALITGSQKALMLPPGIAMIGFSNEAVKKIDTNAKGYYFNLATEIAKQRTNTTAWTAATTLIIGLKEILLKLENIGFEKLYEQTAKRANATRKSLQAIGLEVFPTVPANSMTTIYTENSNEIRKILKNDFDLNIAGGQDHLKGKIFRINHMGLVKEYEAAWAVNSIEMALSKLGIRKFDGTANKIFMESISSL
jgi:aspartate aminotransferase-like enzyme